MCPVSESAAGRALGLELDRALAIVVDPLSIELVFVVGLLALGRVIGLSGHVPEKDFSLREARRGDTPGLGDLRLSAEGIRFANGGREVLHRS